MSKYAQFKTNIRDASQLALALTQLGHTVELNLTPQTLHDYRGKARPEKAEVIIRRKHIGLASNDVGFARAEDGTYQAIISNYDERKFNDRWLNSVGQQYTEVAKMAWASSQGFVFQGREEVETPEGKQINLLFTVRE